MADSIQPSKNVTRGPQLQNDKNPSLEDSKMMDSLKAEIDQDLNKDTSKRSSEEVEPKNKKKRKAEEDRDQDAAVIPTNMPKRKKAFKESEEFNKFLEPDKEGEQKSSKKPKTEQSLGFEPDKMPLRAQDVSRNKEFDISLDEKEKEKPKEKEPKEQDRGDNKESRSSERTEKQSNIFPEIDNSDLSRIASTLHSFEMKVMSPEPLALEDSVQKTGKKRKFAEVEASEVKDTSFEQGSEISKGKASDEELSEVAKFQVESEKNRNLDWRHIKDDRTKEELASRNHSITDPILGIKRLFSDETSKISNIDDIPEIKGIADNLKKYKFSEHKADPIEKIKNKAEVKAKHNITPSQTPNPKGNSKGSGLSK
jgi:hypothetical protein